jgi:hypothetical protein
VAVVVPGKMVFLATPHTGSRATCRALAEIDGAVEAGSHHVPWTELREHPSVRGGELRVSTVRNPYDLMVTWWLQTGPHVGTAFADFVRHYPFRVTVPGASGCLYHHADDSHVLLRWETLEEDLNAVLGWRAVAPVKLQRVGVTQDKRPWQTYYDPEALRAANARFAREFTRHGYEQVDAPGR